MNPIIDPVLIYTIHVFSSLYKVLFAFAVLFPVIASLTIFMCFISDDEEWEDFARSHLRSAIIFEAVLLLGIILVPDQSTMLTMLVFHYITPDNINLVEGHVTDFVLNIVNTINSANP